MSDEMFPKLFWLGGTLLRKLRYGENPHQEAAFYQNNVLRFSVATAEQKQGKELSYNNIADADAAFECVAEFDPDRTAAAVIVKHQTPCGVAEGCDLFDAYKKAYACDPTAAFGGVVALNKILDKPTAQYIAARFVEVIIAPCVTESALEVLRAKKNIRVLVTMGLPDPQYSEVTVHPVAGGFLVQERDTIVFDEKKLTVVTKRKPTDQEMEDLRFAFTVVKHMKSNAIVYAKGKRTVAMNGGQVSRVDAARFAAMKARELDEWTFEADGPRTKGSVAASDAFFPHIDCLQAIIDVGATAVIQPGGSIHDKDLIGLADHKGIAMVFTGIRHFRH